ncbi:hypothetical protein GCM10010106_26770 [Thermopolyspora flexuosa]|nr:hypothetical protein GCM10010106_26770 [Thermopolyspora flexuosa]
MVATVTTVLRNARLLSKSILSSGRVRMTGIRARPRRPVGLRVRPRAPVVRPLAHGVGAGRPLGLPVLSHSVREWSGRHRDGSCGGF